MKKNFKQIYLSKSKEEDVKEKKMQKIQFGMKLWRIIENRVEMS